MKTRTLSTLILILLTVLTFAATKATHAQTPNNQFETNYDIHYKVQQDGTTLVEQNIEITNLQKDVIATNYSISLRHMNIYDASATAVTQILPTEVTEDAETTNIKATLNTVVIGEGKKNYLTISYKTADIATKVGEVWNINIPRVNLLDTTNNYNVYLEIPSAFGDEIFIAPVISGKVQQPTLTIYQFDKEQLENTGISASFGKYQVLNFKLGYELTNETYFTQNQQIALPPNIKGVQQVTYKKLNPKPQKLHLDKDGNTIATYKVTTNQKINITLSGTARLLGKQIKPEYGVNKNQISTQLINDYTKAQPFWDVDDPNIKEIAQTLYDPDLTAAQNTQKAYQFTIANLQYDFEIITNPTVTRKGAVQSLLINKEIGCMEFTDLFITLVRAMGIPAREVNGHAIATETGNKTPLSISLNGGDLLHAWAEFYDVEFGWVPVDPTWGSTAELDYFTKLDTNHFAFVIKGMDSQYPLPAGSYKITGTEKQVEVEFAQDFDEKDYEPKIALYNKLDFKNFFSPSAKNYYLKNESNTVLYINEQPLLMNEAAPYSIKEDEKTIKVADATEKTYEIPATYIDSYIFKPQDFIWGVVVAGLALCTIVYFLIARSMAPKTPAHRLRRLLQGLSQLPSRRLK